MLFTGMRLVARKWHVVLSQSLWLVILVVYGESAAAYAVYAYIMVSWSPMISGLRFMVEHPGRTDLTRTTYSRVIERILVAPFNFNYHFEHHMWPAVPPYRLRRVHRHLVAIGFFDRYPEVLNDGYARAIRRTFR
jgi:fatty acid desaturase